MLDVEVDDLTEADEQVLSANIDETAANQVCVQYNMIRAMVGRREG